MNKTVAGVMAIFVVAIAAAGVFAMGFHGAGRFGGNNSVTAAIEADNYTAFTQALEENNITKAVNETQFNTIVQRYKQDSARRTAMEDAHKAVQNNDFNAWKTAMSTIVKDPASLTQENFNALVQMQQARQKVQQAIASNDFAAWKQAMTEVQQIQAQQFTQERFNQLVQHYNAMQNSTAQNQNAQNQARGGPHRMHRGYATSMPGMH